MINQNIKRFAVLRSDGLFATGGAYEPAKESTDVLGCAKWYRYYSNAYRAAKKANLVDSIIIEVPDSDESLYMKAPRFGGTEFFDIWKAHITK